MCVPASTAPLARQRGSPRGEGAVSQSPSAPAAAAGTDTHVSTLTWTNLAPRAAPDPIEEYRGGVQLAVPTVVRIWGVNEVLWGD